MIGKRLTDSQPSLHSPKTHTFYTGIQLAKTRLSPPSELDGRILYTPFGAPAHPATVGLWRLPPPRSDEPRAKRQLRPWVGRARSRSMRLGNKELAALAALAAVFAAQVRVTDRKSLTKAIEVTAVVSCERGRGGLLPSRSCASGEKTTSPCSTGTVPLRCKREGPLGPLGPLGPRACKQHMTRTRGAEVEDLTNTQENSRSRKGLGYHGLPVCCVCSSSP